jgi:hypothetical protein
MMALLFERRNRCGSKGTLYLLLIVLLALIASASSWLPTRTIGSGCEKRNIHSARPKISFSTLHYAPRSVNVRRSVDHQHAPCAAGRSDNNDIGELLMDSDITIHGVASAGVSQEELSTAVTQALTVACEGQGVSFSLDHLQEVEVPALESSTPPTPTVPGSTGRVLLFQTSSVMSEEGIEELTAAISWEIDEVLYSGEESALRQPILLSIQNKKELPPPANTLEINYCWGDYLNTLIRAQVQEYEMDVPLARKAVPVDGDDDTMFTPSLQLEVDGAMVSDTTSSSSSSGDSGNDDASFWDTSSVLVFDHLVDNDLRRRLLDVVLGKDEEEEKDGSGDDDWDDVTNGPDPRRWIRGGLLDTPKNSDNDDDDDTEGGPCWGLTEDAVEEICFEQHDAFTQFETILSELLSDYVITRLPEAVMGASISPLTANAPTAGDTFDYHVDGDPMQNPPSPWTDIYGRYPNRSPGKPRFMSCLIYLNDVWDVEEWGAPTRFMDVATEESYDVTPKPGRCVLMDQDIRHSVVAPMDAAGKRPRYSLVWKLILHPKYPSQDMKNIGGGRRTWQEPILLGSAKR